MPTMSDSLPPRYFRVPAEMAVRELGDQIGYGRVMQLASQIWDTKRPGGAHAVGPCLAGVVPCPHPESGRDANGHCDWCCGAGWVTKRVLEAMEGSTENDTLRFALTEVLDELEKEVGATADRGLRARIEAWRKLIP